MRRLAVAHTSFCLAFCTALYAACNLLNVERLSRWFVTRDGVDVWPFAAYLLAGLGLFIAAFTLLAHRWTVKPLAVALVVLGVAASYFIGKYDAAIDTSMLLNVLHTDPTEVRQLLSPSMLAYVGVIVLASAVIVFGIDIRFAPRGRYLLGTLILAVASLLVALTAVYWQFNAIQRAGNVSSKYIVWSLVPVNVLYGTIGLAVDGIRPLVTRHRRAADLDAHVTTPGDLVVVLAIGESSRRANFGLYGYSRRDTTPELARVPGLVLLDGVAARASTIHALPQILEKNGVKLPMLVARAGVRTACFVNYSLYDNCDGVGEVKAERCGHGGQCFDEDVIPLLERQLADRRPGYDFIVLHLGGGSHGPLYRDRHPAEFLRFEPSCADADVANRCTNEQLLNSYDDTILYVDHVLAGVVGSLEQSHQPYVLVYLSDHGESLGENGALFHGVPPGVALPKEQAEIPLIVKSSVPLDLVRRDEYIQPDVFDTVLDLLTIRSRDVEASGAFLRRRF